MPRLTVATFNARWGLGYRENTPFDVVDVCRRLDADVLVLVEAWWPDGGEGFVGEAARTLGYDAREARTAPAALRRGRPRVLTPGRRGNGEWGLAVLSRLPVRSDRRIDLPRLPGEPPDRAALVLEVAAGDVAVTVVGTHLGHLTHGSPRQLKALLRGVPGPERPAVLLGDLNMWGPVASLLMPGWRRAVRARTWPGRWPHSQIDHIMVTPPVRVRSGGRLAHTGSDHRPLWAELEVG